MIHAICDFCGNDCDLNAMLLTIKPFQNFARGHYMNEPYGNTDKAKSFVICSNCHEKHKLPNPYSKESFTQNLNYDNYFDKEVLEV